ncbi:MAG: YggS family pyridoxal phosphate-dependent enzyme [Oscillospiraceae bacterium]|nr:YggS family pyridoxal phosphate-dependent enzyme [Oscillospiraceae bacterium]
MRPRREHPQSPTVKGILALNDEFKAIEERYQRIRGNIERVRSSGQDVRIMAVTKTVAPEKINHAISLGIDLIGENRVQEYLSKKDAYLPAETHLIGHLQTNKVKYIIDSVSMIQSVDSLKLASEIDRNAAKAGRIMDILIEINIGGEETKSGIDSGALRELAHEIQRLGNVRLRGLMAIPPIGSGENVFDEMHGLYEELKSMRNELPNARIDTLSMGMSGDYELAVKHGSTLVRIGSGLFGARIYR